MTKDELKNEIKNRISLALKDHILQQGFEIICNENADLKAYNAKLLNDDIEKHNKIVELEAQIEKMKCCENCKHHYWLYEELACRIHKIDVDTCNSWEMVREIKEND